MSSPSVTGPHFWQRFRRNKLAVAGLAALVFLALMAVAAPLLPLADPYASFRQADGSYLVWGLPSRTHPLGTDGIGRDVLSRLVFGSRVSMSVGLVSVSISVTLGTLLGSVAGFSGGWIDNLIMRFTDVVICFPLMFLIITISTLLPPSIYNVMAVIGLVSWTGTCRLVRGEFLKLREMEFVEAARALGVRGGRIIARHMLRNAMAPIVVASTLDLARAILTEASLSFLGVGVQQPIPSWGNMLNEAMSLTVLAHRPLLWLAPGLAVMITVLSINFVGDGLRDALDPRLKM
ncbi:MAG: ABC transporter permease [Bacillota bacterium]|nr:ABC transporter permease [Bacillota bacterium]